MARLFASRHCHGLGRSVVHCRRRLQSPIAREPPQIGDWSRLLQPHFEKLIDPAVTGWRRHRPPTTAAVGSRHRFRANKRPRARPASRKDTRGGHRGGTGRSRFLPAHWWARRPRPASSSTYSRRCRASFSRSSSTWTNFLMIPIVVLGIAAGKEEGKPAATFDHFAGEVGQVGHDRPHQRQRGIGLFHGETLPPPGSLVCHQGCLSYRLGPP